MGKVTVRPHGGSAHWHTPSLQELSSAPIVLPIFKIRKPIPRPKGSIKVQVRKHREKEMTVADSRAMKATATCTTAQESRGRAAKLHLHRRKTKTNCDRALGISPRKRPVGPGTRIGAIKEIPIRIDDDEDIGTEAGLGGGRSMCRNRCFTPSSTSQGILDPMSGSITPSRTSTPGSADFRPVREPCSTPPGSLNSAYMRRETSIYVGPAPLLPSHSPFSQRAAHQPPPSPQPMANDLNPGRHGLSMRAASGDDALLTPVQDMTLSDIPDFDLRKKVADLMAVAPALPVRDLYNPLVDLHGDLATARTQALRASEIPRNRQSVKAEDPLGTTAIRHNYTSARMSVADDDELMVKIDPKESFLEWDSDTPPPPPANERRSRAKRPPPAKNSNTNAITTKPLKYQPSAKITTVEIGASRQSSSAKSRPQITVKRISASRTNHGRGQAVSVRRRFVLPDDVISVDSDMSSSDSDSDSTPEADDRDLEMLDAMPEHLDNLRIRMQPKYAYNEALLGSEKCLMGRR